MKFFRKIKKLIEETGFILFSKSNSFNFELVESEEKLDMVYRLAWKIYVQELKYANLEDYPEQKYYDEYDKYSVSFLALMRGKPIGTLRLILSSPLGFYIEKDCSIIPPSIKPEKIAEISRFIILKKYRGNKRLISFGLLKKALEFSKQKKIDYWYALMSERLKNSFSDYVAYIKPLECRELTREELKKREILLEYYKTNNPIPYIIFLNGVEKKLKSKKE